MTAQATPDIWPSADHAAAEDTTLATALSSVLAEGADAARQIRVLRAIADATESLGRPPHCRIVPFYPGRRPTDEAAHPGLGASDRAAVVTGEEPSANRAICLFTTGTGAKPGLEIRATVRLTEHDGSRLGDPLPGWDGHLLPFDPERAVHQLVLLPESDLAPQDLGFAHAYLRRAALSLTATWGGTPVAGDEAWMDVCDVRNLGGLYRRVIDQLVVPDTARQAEAAKIANPGHRYHPWYPVLSIGTDKAALYTRALVADIVSKECHLADPSWLLRVGVYLELLTCLGIVDAVRDDVGDLLTPDERFAYERTDVFADIRPRVNSEGWKRVWDLRRIAFPRPGVPRAGPVSVTNLLRKKWTTLTFLHVHHEDLEHAIELAGINQFDAQETWQRVFRDAERAVIRKTPECFPELEHLPSPMREAILWNSHGIAGQQGLYATACTEYRASMNAVADWAQKKGLMDHTGPECVPIGASLLDAQTNRPDRVAVLQRIDGYPAGPVVDLAAELEHSADELAHPVPTAEFEALLSAVPILQLLTAAELATLAVQARPLLIMPGERIVIQGTPGDSLFLIADGDVEVMLRRDGTDVPVDTMGRGSVFGEMALLTGAPRAATVRALDTALLFEIGGQQYRPLIRAHPEWLDVLSLDMADRLHRRRTLLAEQDRTARVSQLQVTQIRERIFRRFFRA